MTLSNEDILAVIKILVELRNGRGEVDDIDHLGNRRVRCVGELAENQFRAGLVRVERAVKERLGQAEADNLMPHDLINSQADLGRDPRILRFVAAVAVHGPDQPAVGNHAQAPRLRTGPGRPDARARRLRGARRAPDPLRPRLPDRNAGRPEHRPDQLAGAVRAPERIRLPGNAVPQGRRIGKVTDEIDYLSAIEEGRYIIAQANAAIDETGTLVDELVSAREAGETILVSPERIQYMDVAPAQIVSVAASLIPFLEHDDANRALMGANMQRQAVPCLRPEKALVGTGIERTVAVDSGTTVQALRGGVVDYVDAGRVVIRVQRRRSARPAKSASTSTT